MFRAIIKVIKSLENREILLKEITKKVINQKAGFLGNAIDLLMKVGLPLMKNVLTLLTKSFMVPLRLTAAVSATDAAIKRKFMDQGWLHW